MATNTTKHIRKNPMSGWSLYWVYSDGLEDCFVIARNIRSAIKVECEMNGFDRDEVGAYRVRSIPTEIATSQFYKFKREKIKIEWPWYAWEWLLKRLGAQYRELEERTEILIDGIVYSQGRPPRTIGARYLKEFKNEKEFSEYGEEDIYSSTQNILFTLLGICIARCQEIEHHIAHSFVLAVSSKEKQLYKTIEDQTNAWKRKTFGQLIRSIEESYEIDPLFKASLELFLEQRNKLVHGLTQHPQYDINTPWGQDEMIAFLVFFEFISRIIRKAFRACYYASIDLGVTHFMKDEAPKFKLSKKQREEISIFIHFFKLKKEVTYHPST